MSQVFLSLVFKISFTLEIFDITNKIYVMISKAITLFFRNTFSYLLFTLFIIYKVQFLIKVYNIIQMDFMKI